MADCCIYMVAACRAMLLLSKLLRPQHICSRAAVLRYPLRARASQLAAAQNQLPSC
jgi:hypothetical protein